MEVEEVKMDKAKIVLAVLLAVAVLFIAATQLIAWKNSLQQEFYIKGANDGITARNTEIFNDLQAKGFTAMEITNGNQTQTIVLVPQTQQAE